MSIIFSQHTNEKTLLQAIRLSRHREPKEWVPEVLLLVCGEVLRSWLQSRPF